MTPIKGDIIQVVVVDDSPTARELLVALMQAEEGLAVIGVGSSGEDAVRLVKRLKPDVLTMDVQMKNMDGLEATRQIMRECPLPIILVTSSMMSQDVDLTFRALKAGALTVVRKPGLADPETCANLVQTVRLMAGLPVVHHWGRSAASYPPPVAPAGGALPEINDLHKSLEVIGIASSTGGPGTLATILSALPADFPWPILAVQHVTPGFGLGLAEWLDTQTPLRVRLAEHGDAPQPGKVLLAPDDYHMQVSARGLIELYKGEPYRGLRPSANFMFRTLAATFKARALGIILTGMGDDGLEGLQNLYQAGGLIVAQDEQSCVVYGMPRAVVQAGIASQVLPPEKISGLLTQLAQRRKEEVKRE